jgi:HEAT repeat protein
MKLLTASSFFACVVVLPCAAGAQRVELEEEPAYMGRTFRQWIADLNNGDAEVRHQAAYALAHMGPKISRAFPALKDAAKSSDPSVRHDATVALGYTGPQALPVLLELLESEENRYSAVMGLQRMQPDPFPELIKRLANGEPRQRRAAAAAMHLAMNYMWRQPGEVLPALRVAMKDADGFVRLSALGTLRGPSYNPSLPVDLVLELLKDKDPEVRFRTADFLWEPEAAGPTVQRVLEKLLHDPDGRVRVSAAWALLRLDAERATDMLAVIRQALKDKDEAVQKHAVYAIGQIVYTHRDAACAAVPELIAFVRDYKRHATRLVELAIGNLSSLCQDPKDLIPVLLDALRHAEPEIRERAAYTLAFHAFNEPAVKSLLPETIKTVPYSARLGITTKLLLLPKRPESVVQGLVAVLLGSYGPGPRSDAATLLGDMGAGGKDAIPALRRALEDKSSRVRLAALRAILRIEPDRAGEWAPAAIRSAKWTNDGYYGLVRELQPCSNEVTPLLLQGLKDPDPLYRLGAGFLIIQMARSSRSAVPDLRVALENKDPAVRILAAAALAQIDPRTEGLARVLRAGLTFNDNAVREQAFGAIQRMGPAARELVPDLIRVLKNKGEGQFRVTAARALQQMGAEAVGAGPAFAAVVRDQDGEIRRIALSVLGQIKSDDKALLSTLLDMMRDDPEGWRPYELWQAIQRFGPAAGEELSKRLNDKDPSVRAAYLTVYVNTEGVNHDERYAVLDRALADESLQVRLAAVNFLMRDGRESEKVLRQVLPVVKQCLEATDSSVRMKAISALPEMLMGRGGIHLRQEVISLLLEQAKAKDGRVRVMTLHALGNIRPMPEEAKPIVIQALRDKNPQMRRAAVSTLRMHPGPGTEAVPALIELLKSGDDTILNSVIDCLAQAGRNDAQAVAALIERYRMARYDHHRFWILSALAHCGSNAKDAIPLCVDALKEQNPSLNQSAIRTLMQLDRDNKVLVSALADLYGRERDWYRRGRGFPGQESLGRQAVPELTAILANDKDAERRAGAALVLGSMVQNAKSAETALKNAFKDAESRVGLCAADAYWLVTKDSRTPMPVLLASLEHRDTRLRQHAAQIIAEMGREASHAVPQLIPALKDSDVRVAASLIQAISQMGGDAAPAIPTLVDIVRDSGDFGMRAMAANALMPFGRDAKDAVPALLDMLKNSPHERRTAARALAKIATPAEALPALAEAFAEPIDEHRWHDRHDIAEALVEFGVAGAGAVAELLQHKRSDVRIQAMGVLPRFQKQAQFAVPQLLALMDDPDGDVALAAAEAAWTIDRRKEVLPYFVRGLKAKSTSHRQRAVRYLNYMGVEAKPAVPDLVAACGDRDSTVRREAYQLLSQLDRETARKLGDPDAEGK